VSLPCRKIFRKGLRTIIACAIVLSVISPCSYAFPTLPSGQFNITNNPVINNPGKATTDNTISVSGSNSSLAHLAQDFIKPAASNASTTNSQLGNTRSLPAAPAALVMSLFGFICISTVKDRKLWLAPLVALLCASQTGLRILPRLAAGFGHRISSTKKLIADSLRCPLQRQFYRQRAHLEGTEYIFLLHRLNSIPLFHKNTVRMFVKSYNAPDGFSKAVIKTSVSKADEHKVISEKIINQCNFVEKTLIFQAIPRGPPVSK